MASQYDRRCLRDFFDPMRGHRSSNHLHVWLFGHVKKPPTQKSKGYLCYSLLLFNACCNALTALDTGLIMPSCVVPNRFCNALIVACPINPS